MNDEAIKVIEQYELSHQLDLSQYEDLFYFYKDKDVPEITLNFCKKAMWNDSKDIDI